MDSSESERTARLRSAAPRLRLDLALRTVNERFEAAGVDARLLKGASIRQWLYDEDEPRSSLDIDLLVAPAHAEVAHKVLSTLGYTRDFDDRSMPSWWREHASAWVRDDGVTVDVHHTLAGVGVDDEVAWRLLSRESSTVWVGGREIQTLGLTARALHLALHAAHHGAGWHRPVSDLQRALERTDDRLWERTAALAKRLEAVDAFAAGLRLTESGSRLAERLEMPTPNSVRAALHASTPPPIALGFEQLASAATHRQRVAILWHKAVPPRAFIAHWDPRAAESRAAMARAYLRRPLWLLRQAPEGFRAWRKARTSVRGKTP